MDGSFCFCAFFFGDEGCREFLVVLLEIHTEGYSIFCGRFVLYIFFIPSKWEICAVFSQEGGERWKTVLHLVLTTKSYLILVWSL